MVLNTDIPIPPKPPVYQNKSHAAAIPRDNRFDTNLCDIQSKVQAWIQTAKSLNMDVKEQIKSLVYVIVNAPPLYNSETRKVCEVVQKQQVIVRSLFCNQIICKITKAYVQERAAYTRNFFHKTREQDLVDQLEADLIKKIPVNLIESISNTENICEEISTLAFTSFQEMIFNKTISKLPKNRTYIR